MVRMMGGPPRPPWLGDAVFVQHTRGYPCAGASVGVYDSPPRWIHSASTDKSPRRWVFRPQAAALLTPPSPHATPRASHRPSRAGARCMLGVYPRHRVSTSIGYIHPHMGGTPLLSHLLSPRRRALMDRYPLSNSITLPANPSQSSLHTRGDEKPSDVRMGVEKERARDRGTVGKRCEPTEASVSSLRQFPPQCFACTACTACTAFLSLRCTLPPHGAHRDPCVCGVCVFSSRRVERDDGRRRAAYGVSGGL